MIKLTDRVEELVDIIDNKDESELTATEKLVYDILEAIHLIEGEGLHAFWFSTIDTDNVIKSLDEIGAADIVDMIQSSQWLRSVSDDCSGLTPVEDEHLSSIEDELFPRLDEVADHLDEYLEEL